MQTKFCLFIVAALICVAAAFTPGRRMTSMDMLAENTPDELLTHLTATNGVTFDALLFPNLVDHFDPLNISKYNQRYWINDQYVKKDDKSAPIFITLCCEGQCSEKWVTPEKTMVAQWAKEFNGLLVAIEHRYYGSSQPVEDWSLPNLKYLTLEQALADAAFFIRTFLNPTHNPELAKPIFVNGGSYGGTMATSMRVYYPNLVYGAIAASGVYDARLDLNDLLTVAVESMHFYGGQTCVDDVSTATAFLANKLKSNTQADLDYVNSRLPLAVPLKTTDSPLDRQAFWMLFTDNFIQIVQYNADGSPNYTVEKMCSEFKTSADKFEALANIHTKRIAAGNNYRWTFDQQVEDIGNTKIGDPSRNMRQWWWQSSSAFGWFQPLNELTSKVFGGGEMQYKMDFFFKLIQGAFGPELTEDFVLSRIESQAAKLNQYNIMASNIIFTSGTIDVWRVLATARANRSMNLYSYHIDRTAHCAPLYQPQQYDVLALRSARQSMKNNFITIFNNYSKDRNGMNPGPLPGGE